MKMCNGCKKEKDEKEFGKRWVNGKQYLRTQCRLCESKKRLARPYDPEVVEKTAISREYLHDILASRHNPRLDNWSEILFVLGFRVRLEPQKNILNVP